MAHDAQGRPLRTCVGCRTVQPLGELLRIVASEARRGTLDPARRDPGRGAYLCGGHPLACLRLARKRRSLTRALRISENVIDYEALIRDLEGLTPEEPSSPR